MNPGSVLANASYAAAASRSVAWYPRLFFLPSTVISARHLTETAPRFCACSCLRTPRKGLEYWLDRLAFVCSVAWYRSNEPSNAKSVAISPSYSSTGRLVRAPSAPRATIAARSYAATASCSFEWYPKLSFRPLIWISARHLPVFFSTQTPRCLLLREAFFASRPMPIAARSFSTSPSHARTAASSDSAYDSIVKFFGKPFAQMLALSYARAASSSFS